MSKLNVSKFVASVVFSATCMVSIGQVMSSAEMAEYAMKATCAVAGYEGEGVNEAFRLLVRVSPRRSPALTTRTFSRTARTFAS